MKNEVENVKKGLSPKTMVLKTKSDQPITVSVQSNQLAQK